MNVAQNRMLQRILWRYLSDSSKPGVGNWNPGKVTLILGDRPTEKNIRKYPFIHQTGCAPWLAKQFELVKADESKFYWLNAYSTEGKPLDVDIVNELNPINVIALGNNASEWCHKRGIKHKKVPHPQFWSRFKRKHRYPLLDLIA